MEKISITRALVQLKRIESRLEKKRSNLPNLIAVNKTNENKVCSGTYTKEEFNKKAKSEWQSIKDLIALRTEIKSKIVLSNAKTKVKVAGVEYTVAEAIERKNFIDNFEERLVDTISRVYADAISKVDSKNDSVEESAQLLFTGDESKKNEKGNKVDLMKSYIDINSWELIDPVNMKELKDSLSKEVGDFLAEIDEVLTESNATTFINITKKPSEIE